MGSERARRGWSYRARLEPYRSRCAGHARRHVEHRQAIPHRRGRGASEKNSLKKKKQAVRGFVGNGLPLGRGRHFFETPAYGRGS